MNLLEKKVKELKHTEKKALVFYITPGYPDTKSTLECAKALAESGADILEIGIPFSDPIADGPTIQNSSDAALKNGILTKDVLSLVRQIKAAVNIPVVIMSYLNPIIAGGIERNAKLFKAAGVDGFIIPDVIPEEGRRINNTFKKNGLSLIYLAAPNSSNARLKAINNISNPFVYIVSITGVTGRRKKLSANISGYLKRTKNYISKPRFVGFGISSAEQVRSIRTYCDGIIVGSALIDMLSNKSLNRFQKIKVFAASLRKALDTR